MRLYKIEITQRPKIVTETHEDTDINDVTGEPYELEYVTKHLADPDLRKEWEQSGISDARVKHQFFLPSENKLFRSRTSARDRVKAVERWGGQARILEAEVGDFVPIEVANARRKRERDEARIDKLRDKIDLIRYEAGMDPSW